MNALAREWVDKAEGDFASAGREIRARNSPNYDAACFHSQQSAEKYFKARLQEAGIAFPKTRDLVMLLNLALPLEPFWTALQPALATLTQYAVRFRYPGDSAVKLEARKAYAHCKTVRDEVRSSLGL